MKIITILLASIVPLMLYAQRAGRYCREIYKHTDTIRLEAEYINGNASLQETSFRFRITNTSNHPLKLYKDFIVADENRYPSAEILAETDTLQTNLHFKIIYSNIDNFDNVLCPAENPDCNKWLIPAGETLTVEKNIHGFLFRKGETCKIRFKLNPEQTGLYGISDWIGFKQ